MSLFGSGSHSHSHDESRRQSEHSKTELTGIPRDEPQWSSILGILVGDCMHNFIDGMAVGAAWSQHWGTGIGTTIAVAMHELPHEIGDFIVYKKLGLSSKQAVGLNLFAAMISYAGVFTGVALSSNQGLIHFRFFISGFFISGFSFPVIIKFKK